MYQSTIYCNHCCSRHNKPKHCYETRHHAEKIMLRRERDVAIKLRIYKCPHHNGWHLANKSKKRQPVMA